MKTKVILLAVLSSLFICGCITEFETTGIDEVAGILVVEGLITDEESTIVLSQSVGLNDDNRALLVTDAKVYVECDDGTQWSTARQNFGEYIIETGKLNPERQYRLKIELEENEYCSEFAYPMITPEIDSVFWTKKGKGQPVNIHVATQSPDGMAQYYRWSYKEDWETRALVAREDTVSPYYCSKTSKSKELLFGTNQSADFGKLIHILAEIPPHDDRFMLLYRIDVMQNAISKRAFDYYTSIKRNSHQTGGIMAHVPSELKGNITCYTDLNQPVIGYVDVSTSVTRERLYIHYIWVYEDFTYLDCITFTSWEMSRIFNTWDYIHLKDGLYVLKKCVNCALNGGKSIYELDEWPNQYLKEGWYIRYFENLK